MSIFRTRVTLAAAAVNTNILNGSKFEFLSRNSQVTLWGSDDGTGDALVDFTLGNTVVGEDMPLNNAAVAGDIKRDLDGIGAGVGMAGDRIQIRARNTSAANPVNVNILLEIMELE